MKSCLDKSSFEFFFGGPQFQWTMVLFMQATRHLDIESVDTSFIALGQKLLKVEKSCLALRKKCPWKKVYVVKGCMNKTYVDIGCMNIVYVDKVCMNRVYVNKGCLNKVYVDKGCMNKAHVDKGCMDKNMCG